MSLDRTIRWHPPSLPRPSRAKVGKVLRDFFSDAAKVRWSRDRFFCYLPGKGSSMFRRVGGYDMQPNEKRWIEVWLGDGCIDVMTRQHDEFTNALAAGLARRIHGFWGGEMEDG